MTDELGWTEFVVTGLCCEGLVLSVLVHIVDRAGALTPSLCGWAGPEMLCIKQAPFGPLGFASTVWDSSIVMAKYIEKNAGVFKGKRCVELGAGCGLVGVVLARVGAEVVLTDLHPNLPLLQVGRWNLTFLSLATTCAVRYDC